MANFPGQSALRLEEREPLRTRRHQRRQNRRSIRKNSFSLWVWILVLTRTLVNGWPRVGQIFLPTLSEKFGDLHFESPCEIIKGRDCWNVLSRFKPLIPSRAKAVLPHIFLCKSPLSPNLANVLSNSPDEFPGSLINFFPFPHPTIV